MDWEPNVFRRWSISQLNNQVQKPKQVCDYTILNNKNVNHTLDDIEDVEDDLGDNILCVNQKLITTNNQSPPLLLGAVLQHKQSHEYHQYLIADTGLLSHATQPNAVKRAHKKGFHLIKATRGHVGLQLLEWLQISEHYTVIALHANRPVCRNCYLIVHSLWKKKLQSNEKGCIEAPFSVLDKMPNLAQKYIKAHLNFPLVQNLVVPMMGYVSKEEMQKAIQQKDKEMASFIASMQVTKEQIRMLSNEVKTKDKQLDEKNEHIQMLNKEVNKKDNQLKAKEQKIAALQQLLEKEERNKRFLDEEANKKLFRAIEKNNLNKVNLFFDTYKDVVSARDEDTEKTPFLCAAENGKFEIAKLFKKRGANLNAKDKDGKNALHLICRNSRSVEMVTWLLDECKIDIEAKRRGDERTPFLCAAENRKFEIAKLLKERGANIHAKDEYGNNALYLACGSSGSVEMVTWLLDECKIVGLETKGYYQRTPFLCAAGEGQLAIAKLLKERGANIHAKAADGRNALQEACCSLRSGAMVKWLLDECKLDIETKGLHERTPFLSAVLKGKLAIAKLLKERGANINAKDAGGVNALELAFWSSRNEEIVAWLLGGCKANIEIKGKDENVVFLWAAKRGWLWVAKLLKERGANLNAKDEYGGNALYYACYFSGSEEMVIWLLDVCKIDVETKGKDEMTPFLCAVKEGHVKIAKLLRQRGANLNAKDAYGDNALQLAKQRCYSQEMISYLKEWGVE